MGSQESKGAPFPNKRTGTPILKSPVAVTKLGWLSWHLWANTLTFSITATSSSGDRGYGFRRPHPQPPGLQTRCLALILLVNWVFHSTRLHVANSASF